MDKAQRYSNIKRYVTRNTLLLIAIVIYWMIMDYAYVIGSKDSILITIFEIIFYILPLGFLITSWFALPSYTVFARVAMGIMAIIIACVIGLLILFYVGIPFHFSIGGNL